MAEAFFTEQHELIRKLARDFAEKELTKEVLDKVEETEEFPEEILDKMAKAGFFGVKIPKELGGQGADARSYVLVMEEIARVSGVASIYVSSPNSLSGGPLLLAGNDEQREKYLRPVVTGKKKLAFALTEPGAGSDAGIRPRCDPGQYFRDQDTCARERHHKRGGRGRSGRGDRRES